MSDAPEMAADLLVATRSGDDVMRARAAGELVRLDDDALRAALEDDGARRAFWVDIYNAAVQRQPVEDLAGRMARLRFFRRPAISVAGQALSLDAIEHGILRRSRWKLGLGYAGNPRPSRFEARHRVDAVDPRIHFALNCAAASCPPISAYRAERIDEQLDMATRSYLAAEVSHDDDTITVPVLLLWFIGDFGGPRGLRRFLREHGVEGWGQHLRFAAWDWTPRPSQWAEKDHREA